MAEVVKDIGEIWTRLFDHRPFLSGEIKLFLHEFEEKRDNREVDALFQILQNLTEIKCSQIDKIKLIGDAHFQPLRNNISKCFTIYNRILEKEEAHKSDTALIKKKELRTGEWENFIQEIAKKCEKVDKSFKEKEENITSIKDPTVYIKSSDKLLRFLQDSLRKENTKLPENVKLLIKNKEALLNVSDIEWLNIFLKHQRKTDNSGLLKGKELYDEIEKAIANKCSNLNFDYFLEEKSNDGIYLHELLKGSELVLPKNERIQRNPILAERIERLKKEQEEREYNEMIKNVDMSKKHVVEDTIAYQISMMNRHLIAVAQFLVSVGAGFAFGFFGIEWIIGNLNFGYRLLLGIACAIVIGTAEFYFLAKHLKDEENQEEKEKEMIKQKATTTVFRTKKKLHKD